MPTPAIIRSGERLVQDSLNGPRWPMEVTAEGLGKLRTLLDELEMAAMIVDTGGQILITNAPARTMFRLESQELATSIDALVPGPMRDAHRVYRDVFASMPQARSMSRYPWLPAQRTDGTAFWVQIELTPFWTTAGVWTAALVREAPAP